MITRRLIRFAAIVPVCLLPCMSGCSDAAVTPPPPAGASSGSGGMAVGGGGSGGGMAVGGGGTTGGATTGGAGGVSGGGSGGTGGSGGNVATGAHQMLITLDTSAAGANVSEDVDGYPLAIELDGTNFDFTQAGTMGEDVTFEKADGTVLPHSIEHWDSVGGSAALWVKLDKVVGNMAGQQIRMRWGAPGATSTADSKAVFSKADGFFGVWHLDEEGNTDAGGYKDASEHEAHGTGVAMVTGSRVDARIGKGIDLDNQTGQDTARWVKVEGEKATAFNPGTTAITVSVWALAHSYPTPGGSYETIMCKGDTSWSLQRVHYDTNGYQSCLFANSIDNHFCVYDFEQQPLVTEEWLHFMVVLEEPSMKLYINGAEAGDGSLTEWEQGDHPLGIGNQTQFDGRRQWDGIIDEARVMQVARGASWAKLDYESQREGQMLVTYGAVDAP
jgi:hypothetical protein